MFSDVVVLYIKFMCRWFLSYSQYF